MSAPRRGLRVLFALGVALLTAGLALGAVELKLQNEERSRGMRLPHDEPGRKWALAPKDGVINSQGFNEDEVPFEKPEGVWRVVVVGDSVTFGGEVSRPANYTQIAERALQGAGVRAEVLNLSVYGYDVEQVAATLHHRAWRYDPDLVVYAAYTNDGMPSELLHVGEDQRPVYVGTLPLGGLIPEGLVTFLQRRSALFRGWRGAKRSREMAAEGLSVDQDYARAFLQEHITAMKDDAVAHEVPLLVWALCSHTVGAKDATLCGGETSGPGFCAAQQRLVTTIMELSAGLGLPTATVMPWVVEAGQPGFYSPKAPTDAHHPGEEGHRLFGEAFAEVLLAWRAGAPLPGADISDIQLARDLPLNGRPRPERPSRRQRPSQDP